nr:ulp1 protease family, C-terminal catalytic domain-containing protein [Tanacetum cinerariifolium]
LLYLDSTKFDKFLVVRTRPAIRNWSSHLMKQRQQFELKDHVVGLLDLHDEWNKVEVHESEGFIGFSETSEKEGLIKKAKEKLSLICAEIVILEDYMRKASLKCPSDGKFVALHEKYVNLFKDLISFEDDGNGDNVGNDDDENGDDDGGNMDNDANDCDGNGDEEDVNEGDKDPNGINPSFGFSKISLEDFGNDSGPAEKDKVVEGNPTEQETVVEGNEAEECEIMSTPENLTQWLEKNMDLVGEGDLFGDNSATLEAMNQDITPEKLPTQKGSPSPKKELVIQSKSHEIHSESHVIHSESHVIHSESHVIHSESHVIHSESHVIQIICHMRFIDSESHFIVYGVRLNLETLAPGLWLDANVIDCWGTVLNHEQSFRANESKSKHSFPTGCISKSMFDGTLASFDAKWESFSNQVNAQFKGNKGGLALGGIDLKKLFCNTLNFQATLAEGSIGVTS